jgi:hypothetical protein
MGKFIFQYIVVFLFCNYSYSQIQVCPANINFGDGTLTNWSAYVGNYNGSAGNISLTQYSSTSSSPTGTIGVSSINENQMALGTSTFYPGVLINTKNSVDNLSGFNIIPTINGYTYASSVRLGSTAVTSGQTNDFRGLIRGISYIINVPAGSVKVPYTMTYAYAMVLENGQHENNQQPLAKATLTTPKGVDSCASPSYYLPTDVNGNLDVAAATKNGFIKSSQNSPNSNLNISGTPDRVWYKNWTEVTFDLSAYRGQQVTLTFETHNCLPGGHFAYAYFALRNECDGLQISGPIVACSNAVMTYSVPSLPGITGINWTYPATWVANPNGNTLNITPNNSPGTVQVYETNACDTLTSSLLVNVNAPTVAGNVTGSDSVCTGSNTTTLNVTGNTGSVTQWLSSTDNINWVPITSTQFTYDATNLTQTTQYKAIVQNGSSCLADTSSGATVYVSAKSIGGSILPNNLDLCLGQLKNNILTLSGNNGTILNWQYAYDTLNWQNVLPMNNTQSQLASGNNLPTQYRAIVKNEVCPADTSNIAYTAVYTDAYPLGAILPKDTSICYGDSAKLNISIDTATSYTWKNANNLIDTNNGNVIPGNYNVVAGPLQTTRYIIGFKNGTCPNILYDTATVNVKPKIFVDAGLDTTIVINQPLQLIATPNVTEPLSYEWAPATGLNNPFIYNPVAILGLNSGDTVVYHVKATDTIGCYGENSVTIIVFKTQPDIFVPSAFTPNGDNKNDVIHAMPVGIKKFEYFNIYNRYGQLLFTTPDPEKGWDGLLNGFKQPSGTYIYMARGISYQDKAVFRKGTIVLIR